MGGVFQAYYRINFFGVVRNQSGKLYYKEAQDN